MKGNYYGSKKARQPGRREKNHKRLFRREKPFPITYQDVEILEKKLIKDGYRDCTIGDFDRIMTEELKKYQKSYSS